MVTSGTGHLPVPVLFGALKASRPRGATSGKIVKSKKSSRAPQKFFSRRVGPAAPLSTVRRMQARSCRDKGHKSSLARPGHGSRHTATGPCSSADQFASRGVRERRLAGLIRIFVRTPHPEERLHIDHIARAHGGDAVSYRSHRGKQLPDTRPTGTGLILESEITAPQSLAGHGRFEKEMLFGLRDESEHSCQRPGQNAGLSSRQSIKRRNPLATGSPLHRGRGEDRKAPWQKPARLQTSGSHPGAPSFRTKTEDWCGTDRAGLSGDLLELALLQQPAEGGLAQLLLPADMRVPFLGTPSRYRSRHESRRERPGRISASPSPRLG